MSSTKSAGSVVNPVSLDSRKKIKELLGAHFLAIAAETGEPIERVVKTVSQIAHDTTIALIRKKVVPGSKSTEAIVKVNQGYDSLALALNLPDNLVRHFVSSNELRPARPITGDTSLLHHQIDHLNKTVSERLSVPPPKGHCSVVEASEIYYIIDRSLENMQVLANKIFSVEVLQVADTYGMKETKQGQLDLSSVLRQLARLSHCSATLSALRPFASGTQMQGMASHLQALIRVSESYQPILELAKQVEEARMKRKTKVVAGDETVQKKRKGGGLMREALKLEGNGWGLESGQEGSKRRRA